MDKNNKWHKRFLKLAHEVASWSKDESTKVGAVIIGADRTPRSFGYNGMPRGINDDIPERHERPLKYSYMEHAEKNAIYNCARVGIPINECIIYVTHFPCSGCARAIINSGLEMVVIDEISITSDYHFRSMEDIEISKEMLGEAGIEIVLVKV